jgi:glycosyltransferase involved in cell wall biosynthesis
VSVTLDLIGDGIALPAFRAQARALGLSDDSIRVHGFVEYSEALRMVAQMDVGLIPHQASEGIESTIPNKLFDYMSLALPVVASDVKPIKRILDESGAGVTFRDRDPADLARVIRELHADPHRAEMGRRGIEAVRSRYNWDRDAEVLEKVIERVMHPSATRERSS